MKKLSLKVFKLALISFLLSASSLASETKKDSLQPSMDGINAIQIFRSYKTGLNMVGGEFVFLQDDKCIERRWTQYPTQSNNIAIDPESDKLCSGLRSGAELLKTGLCESSSVVLSESSLGATNRKETLVFTDKCNCIIRIKHQVGMIENQAHYTVDHELCNML